MNKKEILKESRYMAKEIGLTLKQTGVDSFIFTNRKTGKTSGNVYSLIMAWENLLACNISRLERLTF